MNAHSPTPIDPRARLIRSAVFWARQVSNQFDDACEACLGNLALVTSPIAYRIEGKTVTGGTLMIRIEGADIEARRTELTHNATLRHPLPARLRRDLP